MSWQVRDYATRTDEERRRLTGAARAGRPHAGRRRRVRARVRRGVRWAILVAAALLALGQLPKGHPILPSLHVDLPGSRSAPTRTINLPANASVGSTLSLHGAAPPGSGLVTVEGSYDGGQSWETLASVGSADRTYVAQIALSQSGPLQIRIVFADGSQATGTVNVHP